MGSIATPRILPGHIHAFAPSNHPVTSTVRMLGIITTVSGDQATLTCGTESVTIILNRDSHLSTSQLYEIVGKVVPLAGGAGLGIRVLSSTLWPKNALGQLPDQKLFEAVVDATHRYKSIFYDGGDGDDGQANGNGESDMFFPE